MADNVLSDDKPLNVNAINYLYQQMFNNYILKVGQSVTSTNDTNGRQVGQFVGPVDPIYKQYHVVVFSHYPIFCSKTNEDKKSCEKNRIRLVEYLNAFTDFGMDLYLSGHFHYYERTQGICWNKVTKDL